MLRHKNYLQGIFVILATILFITACGSKKTSTQPPVKTVTLAQTNTGTVQPVASPSVSPSLTMTVQPTASPSASPSPTMTASPTQTSSATSTPNLTPPAPTKTVIVTLDASHMSELTLELLENNGGCQLPCWWGIMPGETSWEEALAFLAQFDSKIYKSTTDDERFAEANIPVQSSSKGEIGNIVIRIYTPNLSLEIPN